MGVAIQSLGELYSGKGMTGTRRVIPSPHESQSVVVGDRRLSYAERHFGPVWQQTSAERGRSSKRDRLVRSAGLFVCHSCLSAASALSEAAGMGVQRSERKSNTRGIGGEGESRP